MRMISDGIGMEPAHSSAMGHVRVAHVRRVANIGSALSVYLAHGLTRHILLAIMTTVGKGAFVYPSQHFLTADGLRTSGLTPPAG